MKRTIFTSILSLLSFTGFAQQHDVMVVEKADNTTTKLSVENIKRISFESLDIIAVTGDASNITESRAAVSGTIETGDLTVTAGVLYGKTYTLSVADGAKIQKASNGNFTVTLSNLMAGTNYYYRTYVEFDGMYFYGETRSFMTKNATTGTHNGHDWIDLGLSVKWATCNVGASSPSGYGDYYAWGETATKSRYYSGNYKYYDESSEKWIKYNDDDGKKVLDLSDDAAHVNWGGDWRMPTYNEYEELKTMCTWTWTTQNGVYGRKVTGPNGNCIFLPAAGQYFVSNIQDRGTRGYYWSSSLWYSDSANTFGFNSDAFSWWNTFASRRYYGNSVRAVCE